MIKRRNGSRLAPVVVVYACRCAACALTVSEAEALDHAIKASAREGSFPLSLPVKGAESLSWLAIHEMWIEVASATHGECS